MDYFMISVLLVALGIGILIGAIAVLYFFYFEDNFEEELKEQLDEFIDIHSHEIAEHFEKYGWGLCTSSYQEYILGDLFGMDLENYIRNEVIKKTNSKLIYNSTIGTMYAKKGGYCPIYMNNETGEIKVIENADIDKSYVFEHREEDGFTEIGFL